MELNTLVPLGRGPVKAATAHQPVIMLLNCTTKKVKFMAAIPRRMTFTSRAAKSLWHRCGNIVAANKHMGVTQEGRWARQVSSDLFNNMP
jgi:hypothetical protein